MGVISETPYLITDRMLFLEQGRSDTTSRAPPKKEILLIIEYGVPEIIPKPDAVDRRWWCA